MIAGMRLLLRATERAAALAGAALGAQNLEERLAKFSGLERRILARFLRREIVARSTTSSDRAPSIRIPSSCSTSSSPVSPPFRLRSS
jgi:hypothetical protein